MTLTGTLTFQAERDLNNYKYHTSAGAVKGLNSIFFNGQPFHVGAAALADWQASRLAELTGKAGSIKISNQPLEPKSYAPPIMQITNTSKLSDREQLLPAPPMERRGS